MEQEGPDRSILQQILEEQGYLIMSSILPIDIGDIIPCFGIGVGMGLVSSPAVVIGYASAEDFQAQRIRYHPDHEPLQVNTEGYFFLKVIAE